MVTDSSRPFWKLLGETCLPLLPIIVYVVAIHLQDPFSGRPSDTPMLALSRTIEFNIKQMLSETELPEKIGPVNGVLY